MSQRNKASKLTSFLPCDYTTTIEGLFQTVSTLGIVMKTSRVLYWFVECLAPLGPNFDHSTCQESRRFSSQYIISTYLSCFNKWTLFFFLIKNTWHHVSYWSFWEQKIDFLMILESWFYFMFEELSILQLNLKLEEMKSTK